MRTISYETEEYYDAAYIIAFGGNTGANLTVDGAYASSYRFFEYSTTNNGTVIYHRLYDIAAGSKITLTINSDHQNILRMILLKNKPSA